MLIRRFVLAALLLAACKSDSAAPADEDAAAKKAPSAAASTPTTPTPAPVAAPDAAPAAEPALPTDPKELEVARKKAILEGKFDVAVKVCAAEDVKSLGEQNILACVLSACRQGDAEKAATWGKLLKGALKTQARKVCAASNIHF